VWLGSTLGGPYRNLMLIGRFIFGMGGESINNTVTVMVTQWFTTDISLALSINLTFTRIGAILNDLISPSIVNKDDISSAYAAGVGMCAISFMAAMLACFLDSKY
jgi:hypothetical protein